MDLNTTFMSCIFRALFRDTPHTHVGRMYRRIKYVHNMHNYTYYAHLYAPNMAMWGIPEKSVKNAAEKR